LGSTRVVDLPRFRPGPEKARRGGEHRKGGNPRGRQTRRQCRGESPCETGKSLAPAVEQAVGTEFYSHRAEARTDGRRQSDVDQVSGRQIGKSAGTRETSFGL